MVETVILAQAPVERRILHRLWFVQTPGLLKVYSSSGAAWCLLHVYFLRRGLSYAR